MAEDKSRNSRLVFAIRSDFGPRDCLYPGAARVQEESAGDSYRDQARLSALLRMPGRGIHHRRDGNGAEVDIVSWSPGVRSGGSPLLYSHFQRDWESVNGPVQRTGTWRNADQGAAAAGCTRNRIHPRVAADFLRTGPSGPLAQNRHSGFSDRSACSANGHAYADRNQNSLGACGRDNTVGLGGNWSGVGDEHGRGDRDQDLELEQSSD